jgi:hypothetical protein
MAAIESRGFTTTTDEMEAQNRASALAATSAPYYPLQGPPLPPAAGDDKGGMHPPAGHSSEDAER